MNRKLFPEIIPFLFMLLFTYAALTKLLDFEKFRVQLGQSPILTSFAGWIAWSIPSSEILISAMLAIPRFRMIGLYGSLSLMIMFTTYIILIQHFSSFVPCSCGGILQSMGWTTHLIFNLVFTGLAVGGIHLEEDRFKEPSPQRQPKILLQ